MTSGRQRAAATRDARQGQLDDEVQGLALTTYRQPCVWHLVLAVREAAGARQFLAALLAGGWLNWGRGKPDAVPPGGLAAESTLSMAPYCAVNIGFSFNGLQAMGAPEVLLRDLLDKSPAFAEGAPSRAARFLGDAGPSAAERWEGAFAALRAHVWLAVHGATPALIGRAVEQIRQLPGASTGLDGWPPWHRASEGANLTLTAADGTTYDGVHFGFRDNLTKPRIGPDEHAAGELLLGYLNDDAADVWTGSETTGDDIAHFLRNGSFGVFRKIRQFEGRLAGFLDAQVEALAAQGHAVSAEFLKAKMCGRWTNGAVVQPGDGMTAPTANAARLLRRPAKADPQGLGCPFGAHIRRANPADDPLMPTRARTLFRRGVPYGPALADGDIEVDAVDRGLLGVFFCARIEDQFEQLVAEWIEKNPLGPPNRGRAKDPLLGQHDDPDAEFHIPLDDGGHLALKIPEAFVQTLGTLYAFFPSRAALRIMCDARWDMTPPGGSGGSTASPAAKTPAPPGARTDAHTKPASASASAAPSKASAPPENTLKPDPLDEAAKRPIASDAMNAPADRFCDIVMEGGITSGIIYASAVVELARHYRFKNIGGSSIGAFGAALTAAAEFRRRGGSGAGFHSVSQLPDQLAQEEDGRTLLERLFVPEQHTRRLFEVFLALLDRGGGAAMLAHGLRAALWQYRRWIAIVAAVAVLLVLAGPLSTVPQCDGGFGRPACWLPLLSWGSALGAALVLAVLVGVVGGLLHDFTRGVVKNGFGLCRGWSKRASLNPPDTPDLAGYLHGAIQSVAGEHPIDDPPLTFDDLWNAPDTAAEALGPPPRGTPARAINLEMYASNLAHGRPYRFPLAADDDMGRLFYRSSELADYFPAPVLAALVGVSVRYAPKLGDPDKSRVPADMFELPVGKMPVVVAVRLAMSFPLLLSAVPLYAIDRKGGQLSKCWMSDGGLCSNFPIHLFDSFVPRWPTFGIALYKRLKGDPQVRLPELHVDGREDAWDHGAVEASGGLGQLSAFLKSIWITTWHWNDSTMMRMPGVRDRVVRIYLGEGEGGVNIRMRAEQIRQLGDNYGRAAAHAFIRKFALPDSPGWPEHRWVRLNTLLDALRQRLDGLGASADCSGHTLPLGQQIAAAMQRPPLRPTDPKAADAVLSKAQAEELQQLVEALRCLENSFGAVEKAVEERLAAKQPGRPFTPVPRPSMRIRHPT